jgi:hypothetical protein
MEPIVDLIKKLEGKFDVLAELLMADTTGQFPERQMAVQLLANYLKRLYEEKEDNWRGSTMR